MRKELLHRADIGRQPEAAVKDKGMSTSSPTLVVFTAGFPIPTSLYDCVGLSFPPRVEARRMMGLS